VNSPDHTTLDSLVIAAGLVDELASTDPFTAFAPTDAAFTALPEEVVSSLTADPTGALANVLLFHVVSGVADGSNISDDLTIGNLQGGNLMFSISDGNISINGINVSVVDIKTDNCTYMSLMQYLNHKKIISFSFDQGDWILNNSITLLCLYSSTH